MILADYIAIAIVVLLGAAGAALGFGKGLRFLTKGIFGVILSVIVSGLLMGAVLSIPAVQDLMARFVAYLTAQDNGFCRFLLIIRIEYIAVGVAVFSLIQLARIIAVTLIERVMEVDHPVIKIVNKLLGTALAVVAMVSLALVTLQVVFLATGAEGSQTFLFLQGSFFRLDYVYLHNPLGTYITLP